MSESRPVGKQDKPIQADTQCGHAPWHLVSTTPLEGCHNGDTFPLWKMHFYNPHVHK